MLSRARHGLSLLGLVVTLGLAACGGDDDSPPPPSPPAAAPAVTLRIQPIKVFRFTWTDVADATEYRLLEDPDSVTGYAQVAAVAAGVGQHDLVVSLPKRINARYLLQACNAGGCVDSAPVAVSGASSGAIDGAIGYFKASNPGRADYFGGADTHGATPVALSADGTTLVVGARREGSGASGIGGNEADDSMPDSGAVYVFVRSGATWSQQAYIKASNPGAGDNFGVSVALSADGHTLAVGAHYEGSAAIGIDGNQGNDSAPRSGAVYVFTRSGATWSQQAYVKASNAQGGDSFGFALALSADGATMAVGAFNEASGATGIGGDQADNSVATAGAVYVFTRTGTTWTQQAYVKASNTGVNAFFGRSVALSADGHTLAVGAMGEGSAATGIGGAQDDNSAAYAGAAYVFMRSGTAWSQQAYIKASNTGAGDAFGGAVALSADGHTLAVAGMWEDSAATGIDGDAASNAAAESGAVYVFVRSGSAWSQQAYLKASNTQAQDSFGWGLALSADGRTLAAGAIFEDSRATGLNGDQGNDPVRQPYGAVYLYTRSGSAWAQQAYVKNTNRSPMHGSAVALSADGGTLAVSAMGDSSAAAGIGGDQADTSMWFSGAVFLY